MASYDVKTPSVETEDLEEQNSLNRWKIEEFVFTHPKALLTTSIFLVALLAAASIILEQQGLVQIAAEEAGKY
jgi:hypothetical protein